MRRSKCCNFKLSGLGGWSFVYVGYHSLDKRDLPWKYYFQASVVMVDNNLQFVSGGMLTHGSHKTFKEVEERWEDLGPAFVEVDSDEYDDHSFENLAKLAMEKMEKTGQYNRWWVN